MAVDEAVEHEIAGHDEAAAGRSAVDEREQSPPGDFERHGAADYNYHPGNAMLESQVLVLNRVFQAVQVTSVRKAFSLFYKGHVRAVLPDYST